MKKLMACVSLTLLLGLTACGGSSDSGSPAEATAFGKVHLASPLVGASIQVRDEKGRHVMTSEHTTDASGVFELTLPPGYASRFQVVATGGTYEGQAFQGTLRLDAEQFNAHRDLLYVNAATTLISDYVARHPGTSVSDASRKVKAFLQIPVTSDAGFNVDNPLQNYFRHENLLAAVKSSGNGQLNDYLGILINEMEGGAASHSFARAQLKGGEAAIVGALMKFLGHALADEAVGLAFEHAMTALGLDGTAEILRELHEINHKLDELTALTHAVLAAEKDTQLQALTIKLSNDVNEISGLYRQLTTVAQRSLPACLMDHHNRPLDEDCVTRRNVRLQIQQNRIQQHIDTILKGANGTTSIDLKLADIANTLITMSSVEPGLLGRASEFLKTSRPFDAPITDPRLVSINEYYQTLQAMGVHLLVEAYMAQKAPEGAGQEERRAWKEQAKLDSQAAIDLLMNAAKAQDDRIEELRYKNEDAIEQLRANLVWLRAPFSNLKTPVQNSGGGWGKNWQEEAEDICADLRHKHYAGFGAWRLPTEEELHAFVKGSPNDSGNADGGNGIFDWLVGQGFLRGPGNGALNQRGIVVDNTMKTAYFSSTLVAGGYAEALWDYGVDSAADIPKFRSEHYIPSIAGAWCVSDKGGSH